ncbi:MAG: crossover junction endodeoxyribonuclease RuvC [Chlamydiales bacterium]
MKNPEDSSAAEAGLASVPEDFPWPIVLGIDPGTLVVGYGALVCRGVEPRFLAAGTLRAPRSASVPERLGVLSREFDLILERLRPRVVVLEEAFAARNVQSALRIGEGRGMLLAAAVRFGAEVVQFPPAVAKKAVAGNGRASKEQVAAMVARSLGLTEAPKPLDASDALALALAHVYKSRSRAVSPSR